MSVYSHYQQQQYYDTSNNNPSNPNHHAVAAAVTVAPQDQGMIWNGSQWVPVAGQQPQQPSKAELYTNYYHQWTASHTKFLDDLKYCAQSERQDVENKIQWAKYYADLSSQAAHFFYNNPNAISAPFQLPPSPISDDPNINKGSATTMTMAPGAAVSMAAPVVAGQPQQQHDPNAALMVMSSSDSGTGEGALKRYVDRCLVQCTTPEMKNEMIQLIERMIQQHLQENTYHTAVWDQKVVLQLSSNINNNYGKDQPIQQFSDHSGNAYIGNNFSSHSNTNNWSSTTHNNYYGPPGSTNPSDSIYGHAGGSNSVANNSSSIHHSQLPKEKNQSRKRNKFSSVANVTDSYYGPPTSAGLESTTPLSHMSKKQKTKHPASKNKDVFDSDKYYGPSSETQSCTNSNPSGEEDFISLFSSNDKKHKEKADVGALKKKNTGFNQSDSALNDRTKRFAARKKIVQKSESLDGSIGNEFDRYMGKSTIGGGKSFITLDEADYEKMTIKGTCEILEKDYLRLTAPPKAELVRPQPILERHLSNLKEERLRSKNKDSSRDYLWFCSQLKAIRQDCTVQRIQNAFAIDVYETHARMALEEDDLNEYNQCQTQLEELYRSAQDNKNNNTGTKGDASEAFTSLANRNEFLAYRIIYHVFLTGNKKYDGGSTDLFKIMLALTPDQQQDPAIQHSLKVREACSNHDMFDYHLFFRLYDKCPNLGSYLMKYMIPAVRYQALLRISKGYRPGNVEIDFIAAELGFPDVSDVSEWLLSCGCVLSEDGTELVTRDSNEVHESTLEEKKSLI